MLVFRIAAQSTEKWRFCPLQKIAIFRHFFAHSGRPPAEHISTRHPTLRLEKSDAKQLYWTHQQYDSVQLSVTASRPIQRMILDAGRDDDG